MKTILLLILLQVLSTNSFADNNMRIVTTCEVQKGAYVYIDSPDNPYVKAGLRKKNKVMNLFNVENNPTGEKYQLVLMDNIKKLNILYYSKKYPIWNFNMLEDVEKGYYKYFILSDSPDNLVIKTYCADYERTYHFGLDKDGSGLLSISTNRWASPAFMDSINGQNIMFATCKR